VSDGQADPSYARIPPCPGVGAGAKNSCPPPTGAHDLGISLDPALDPVAKPGVKPTLPRFQNHNQSQHPTTVKRAYDATHKTAATPAAKGETRVEKLEHEIERLTFEVEAWGKKAEADGSPVRHRDSLKNIASTVIANVTRCLDRSGEVVRNSISD